MVRTYPSTLLAFWPVTTMTLHLIVHAIVIIFPGTSTALLTHALMGGMLSLFVDHGLHLLEIVGDGLIVTDHLIH